MPTALRAIMRVARKAKLVTTLTLPVNPVPASRPRVGRYGVFYEKKYITWRDAAYECLPDDAQFNIEGPLLVVIESVVQSPKKSKLTHPKPDIDNYAKAPMDALTKVGGIWDDDYQVVYLLTNKRWTKKGEDPHTTVEIYTIEEDTRPS